ncbi:hypothetical protein DL96DRAFT_1591491 [Flagelloscypha sp. PMI_526]|nr:hypothetical protein DL96DRAFT_1591491 [Flagelloscypha sp. PMI_526]
MTLLWPTLGLFISLLVTSLTLFFWPCSGPPSPLASSGLPSLFLLYMVITSACTSASFFYLTFVAPSSSLPI